MSTKINPSPTTSLPGFTSPTQTTGTQSPSSTSTASPFSATETTDPNFQLPDFSMTAPAVQTSNLFTDTRAQTDSQSMLGTSLSTPLADPFTSPGQLTPFQNVPAIDLNPPQALFELNSLSSLGQIKYDLLDNGHIKLYSPAFGVEFRHTSQTEAQAEHHWFDFPEPQMAVDTARLAQWAGTKGIDEITHRGFWGESGEGIDFGPKPAGMESPKPAATPVATQATHTEPTTPAPILDITSIKTDTPPLAQTTQTPTPTVTTTAPTAPTAQTTAPTAQTTPTATKTPEATAPAQTTPAQAPTTQTKPEAEKPAESSGIMGTISSIGNSISGAVKRFLQLDIAGVKGENPETGQRFDMNAYREFTQAPHKHYMQSIQSYRRESQQDEQRMEKEREHQRYIERQMNDQQYAERLRQMNTQLRQEQLTQQSPTAPQPAKDTLLEKREAASTGAFHSPFSSLHSKRLFEQLDDTQKK